MYKEARFILFLLEAEWLSWWTKSFFDGANWLLCTTGCGLGVLGVDQSADSEIQKAYIAVHIKNCPLVCYHPPVRYCPLVRYRSFVRCRSLARSYTITRSPAAVS